ncbi:MAG: NUDIX domain-containing protein [Candidatus Saccharimonas sp.]
MVVLSNDNYHLSDEEYGKVLDNIVVACVDVAVIHGDNILLERRVKEPAKNFLWIFGGRMKVGESFQQTAQRGVARELGINLAENRFHKLDTYSLVWPLRRESPSQNGCHHVLVAHYVEIDESEKTVIDATITSSPNMQWFEVSEIESLDETPELSAIVRDVKAKRSSSV